MNIADFNDDGQPEIYLGGINNEYHMATLVVLDPEHLSGVSRQTDPNYQLEGPINGKELARILLPRSCINERFEHYNSVGSIEIQERRIIVGVRELLSGAIGEPAIIYEFGPDLKLEGISASDSFLN